MKKILIGSIAFFLLSFLLSPVIVRVVVNKDRGHIYVNVFNDDWTRIYVADPKTSRRVRIYFTRKDQKSLPPLGKDMFYALIKGESFIFNQKLVKPIKIWDVNSEKFFLYLLPSELIEQLRERANKQSIQTI